MVVILQQTTDNGKRFVSTVVEEETSLSSSFSGLTMSTDSNSVSERSAIYKQRIDSLFGYPKTRMSGQTSSVSSLKSGSPRRDTKSDINLMEDEGYQVIDEEVGFIVPDSLNFERSSSVSKPTNGKTRHADDIRTIPITRSPSENLVRFRGWEIKATNSKNLKTNPDWGLRKCLNGSSPNFDNSPNGILHFPVEYLGSVPIEGLSTVLQDLQIPLCFLYLNFLKRSKLNSGQLSITGKGLRFDSSKLQVIHSFNSISVWAAIKFVVRGDPVNGSECAFMPLISDPEAHDKGKLFDKMNPELGKTYRKFIEDSGETTFRNPPIFACVIRETVMDQEISECHAFTCKCAEDAIVIAANLYQYLLANEIKFHKEGESGYGSLSRSSPQFTDNQSSPNRNGSGFESQTGSSSASSGYLHDGIPNLSSGSSESLSLLGKISSEEFTRHPVDIAGTAAQIPIRPPRKKNGTRQTRTGTLDESHFPIVPRRRKSFRVGSNQAPRSQYMKVKKRVQITTPSEEMFKDVVVMHDHLDKLLEEIVSSEGKSFHELKLYGKLIRKLALALTQEKYYKKRKDIAKRQQRFGGRHKKVTPKFLDESEPFPQFLSILLKPFSRIRSSPKTGKKVHSGKFLRNPLTRGYKPLRKSNPKASKNETQPLSICTGCSCENCSEKCYCSLPMKQKLKTVGSPSEITSSNTVSQTNHSSFNNSSKKSGENLKKCCGYDTDSCAESEKCYCSLQGVKSNGIKIYNINLDTETSDTDSNSYHLKESSNPQTPVLKKYTNPNNVSNGNTNSLVKTVSFHSGSRFNYTHSSPKSSTQDVSKAGNNLKNLRTSKHSDPGDEEFHRRGSPSLRQRKKVLFITGSNTPAKLIYKGQHFHKNGGHLEEILEQGATEPEDTFENDWTDSLNSIHVLDMKKSAEIEAMFKTLRLGEELRSSPPEHRSHFDIKKANGASDFQTSLGYLP